MSDNQNQLILVKPRKKTKECFAKTTAEKISSLLEDRGF